MRVWARAGALRRGYLFALLGWAVAGGACVGRGGATDGPVVYAAASLRDVAVELSAEFERREGARVELNLAGSNTLAQQVLAAPGPDVFISADRHWVEVLEKAGRLAPGSRRALLGNRLVVVAARRAELQITALEDLADARYSFLALADPQAVPAGRYARGALEEVRVDDASLWQRLADRVAPALDVRAALALVESDPRIVGIVYRTDALQSERVRVLYELPRRGAARVTYYGALIVDGTRTELGDRFLAFVASPAGRRITERHGFEAAES